MPAFEKHCEQTKQALGKDFAEVHAWLDELFQIHGARHRRFRHHLAGVEEVRQTWGDQAAEAARLHIIADLKEEGWREGVDRLPEDADDYRRMGLF